MCISPVLISNPYKGMLNYKDGNTSKAYKDYASLRDTTSAYIRVPCGHCSQCVQLKQSYWVQRMQIMSFDHMFFMLTLTYKDEMLPYVDVFVHDKPARLKYADTKDIQNYIKRLRKADIFDGRKFSYMAVSEFGKETHRPHWHLILAVKKLKDDNDFTQLNFESILYKTFWEYWSRNIGSTRSPNYVKCSDLVISSDGRRSYDFHAVTIRKDGFDDIYFYVTKYVLKVDPYVNSLHSALKLNYDEKEYRYLWSIVKPKFLVSKNLGNPSCDLARQHLVNCLASSDELPSFNSPNSNFRSPLSPYVKRKFLTLDLAKQFNIKPYPTSKGYITPDDAYRPDELPSPDERDQIIKKFEKTSKLINRHNDE